MLLGEGTLGGFTPLQINVNKSPLKGAFKYGAVSVILSKREDFRMIDYQTIAVLVDQIPTDTWDVLKQIKERRPAMMLSELIECRTRPPERSEPRSPTNEPV
jgi:hypothetical protein